mgnify:CR=1 FL=1|tara:strand:- start:109 stop:429 length:321 start_codon:yes stop_codon:yes gene_type:complete
METGIILAVAIILTQAFVLLRVYNQNKTNKFLEGEAEAAEHGFKALMEDFTNYQVKCDRELAKLEKELEVKTKQLERSQVKLQKDLPNIIRKTIAHIEFAQPLDRK